MNNTSPEISIIIANYNSGEFLAGTLQSLLSNPPSREWEAIIFDNASTDNSVETAKSAINNNPRCRFIRNDINLGFAGANNNAIKEAKGEYLLLLNPDTAVPANAIDYLYHYLTSHDDVGAVGPHLIDTDNLSTVSFGYFPTIKGILAGAFLPKRLQKAKSGTLGITPDRSITEPLDVGYISGACLMTRHSIWDMVGNLDESFFAYFEETDWCLRLKKKGYRIVFMPDVIVKHFEGKSFSGIQEKKMEIFVKSAIKFFDKHYSPGLKFCYLTSNIIASALKVFCLNSTGLVNPKLRERIKPALAHHRAFLKALVKVI